MQPISGADPRISVGVVIPVFNRRRLVIEALESVAAQTCAPDRVAVVDDGSTDGTADEVRAWMDAQDGDTAWVLIERPREGAASARNAGFGRVEDLDVVGFLDSDDLWPPDMLARARAAFQSDPSFIGVVADRLSVDCRRGHERLDDVSELVRSPLRWLVLRGAGIGSCSIVRTGAVRGAGVYPSNEPTGHDLVLFTRLFVAGPWGRVDGPPVRMRRNHSDVYHEEGHNYTRVPNVNERWARLTEIPHAELRRRGEVSIEVRRSMARRWLSAARDCVEQGRLGDGRECLRRASSHWPLDMRNIGMRMRLVTRQWA